MSGYVVIADEKHLATVCRIGQRGDCCRYLVASSDGMTCAKHGDIAPLLDRTAASGYMTARGDNCPGYGR